MPRPKSIPAAAFFAGRSFHQVRPIIPTAYADPIETGPLTDDEMTERSVSTWSPAQAVDYRRAA